jgi:hypothetical protein
LRCVTNVQLDGPGLALAAEVGLPATAADHSRAGRGRSPRRAGPVAGGPPLAAPGPARGRRTLSRACRVTRDLGLPSSRAIDFVGRSPDFPPSYVRLCDTSTSITSRQEGQLTPRKPASRRRSRFTLQPPNDSNPPFTVAFAWQIGGGYDISGHPAAALATACLPGMSLVRRPHGSRVPNAALCLACPQAPGPLRATPAGQVLAPKGALTLT